MFSEFNPTFLCNFDAQVNDNAANNDLWLGRRCSKNVELCKEILATGLESDVLAVVVTKYLNSNSSQEEILYAAICAFLTFCNQNWNPSAEDLNVEQYFGTEWPKRIKTTSELQFDSEEICINIVHPELLLFSSRIFGTLCAVEHNLVHIWWHFRCKIIHQRVLDGTSATLYSEVEIIMEKLCKEAQSLEVRLRTLLYAELCQATLLYDRIDKANTYLTETMSLAGLKLELTGVLGKRTKFQREAVPQLALSSSIDTEEVWPAAAESHGSTKLPTNVTLQDDVRLSQVKLEETVPQVDLPALEQTLCLLNAQYLQKAQPKDNLLDEELLPYIETVLAQENGPWSTHVATLLLRCKLEAKNKRTVERAMMQCEEIIDSKCKDLPINRLSYLWASGVSPMWCWKQQLADLYCSMGLVKAALDIYLKLQLWEDVILSYTLMQLRHKAAEVIQQQLTIEPTVKLYCYLGDATDNVSCYEKAWELSNHKSSRAQRHWGNYLFNIKKYDECIPHYEMSLEINSLQESVWLRLGYAALVTEQWEKAGKAYRRYTYLHPNSFEAWNNLAKVYVKQGNKQRAYKTLMEAIKYNYDNWKLWENVITVSVDVGQFGDVILGCHRVLDLQNKYLDIEVLSILVQETLKSIREEGHSDDVPKNSLRKSVLELFGRITSIHRSVPEIWYLYADISPQPLKVDRLIQAYRAYTQTRSWPDNPETCKKVIQLGQRIIRDVFDGIEKKQISEAANAQILSSVRLMARAVIKTAQNKNWPDTQTDLQELQELFDTFMEKLNTHQSIQA